MTTVVGTVISEVRAGQTREGQASASFRVASNERRYDRSTGRWVDGDRLFLTVRCWRQLAENVTAALRKGDPVVAQGRLHTRDYDVEGQRRYAVELVATTLGFDLARCRVDLLRGRPEIAAGGGPDSPEPGASPVPGAGDDGAPGTRTAPGSPVGRVPDQPAAAPLVPA